jgi:hypothetical protein
MIYYSTILNDEIDFLKLQLELNYPYVDKFVITESSFTFSNRPKPLYYFDNKHLFEKYQDKIIHFIVDFDELDTWITYPSTVFNADDWRRERKQRNYILENIVFTNDDVLICVDIDEIVFLEQCINEIDKNDVNYLELDMRKYYMNLQCTINNPWIRALSFNPNLYKQEIHDLWHLRFLRNKYSSYKLIKNAGYHFSWCYNVENKLLSFAHQEDNTIERYNMVRDRIKRLEDTRIMNNLPEFLYSDYSKYIYK